MDYVFLSLSQHLRNERDDMTHIQHNHPKDLPRDHSRNHSKNPPRDHARNNPKNHPKPKNLPIMGNLLRPSPPLGLSNPPSPRPSPPPTPRRQEDRELDQSLVELQQLNQLRNLIYVQRSLGEEQLNLQIKQTNLESQPPNRIGYNVNRMTNTEAILSKKKGLRTSGLTVLQRNSIPEVQYTKRTVKEHCAICLGEFKLYDRVKINFCFHKFHADCLDEWFEKKSTCPVCNFNYRSINTKS